MNKKGLFGMASLFVGILLVFGNGRAFAIDNAKMPAWKQNWTKDYFRADTYKTIGQTIGENFKLMNNVGAWSDCIEMKDGKKVAFSPNIQVNNIERIKTVSGQYIEFVTWDGKVPWDTIKAKKGAYWRIEPNSEVLFVRDPRSGKIFEFGVISGAANVDKNYITIGEAVEFAESIAASIKYDKIKSEVNGWKNLLRDPPVLCNPATAKSMPMFCGCGGNLTQHTINQYVQDAALSGAALGALPTALALPAEYLKVMPQYRKNAALAYAVACSYEQFPTKKQFELHLLEMLSGGNFSNVRREQINGMAGVVRDEFIEKAAIQIAKEIAPNLVSIIPGVGTAVGVAIGGVTGGSDANKFGSKARDFYKPK